MARFQFFPIDGYDAPTHSMSVDSYIYLELYKPP